MIFKTDEFRPDSGSEDDEETIAKAEEEAAGDVKAEVAALEKESQMDLDDFLNDLPPGYLENRDKILLDEEKASSAGGDNEDAEDTDDAEFKADVSEEDDENTISQEEAQEMDVDHQKEIDELEADNDLTVEQLMEKYKTGKNDEPTATSSRSSRSRKNIETVSKQNEDDILDDAALDSDDVSTADEEDDSEEESESGNSSSEMEDENETEEEQGLKSLLDDVSLQKKS